MAVEAKQAIARFKFLSDGEFESKFQRAIIEMNEEFEKLVKQK